VSPGDSGQLLIKHAGEGEQVVALVLQRDAHRANAPGVLGLTALEFRDDEVEQDLPCDQGRSGQRQNVMAQPLGEQSDVAGQTTGPRLGLPRKFQLDDKLAVRTRRADAVDPGLEFLTPRGGALGEARQRIGQAFTLVLDVKHIAMAGRVVPSGLLSGTQALSGVGDCVVRLQPLPGGVE
jgi:hypothetical protein